MATLDNIEVFISSVDLGSFSAAGRSLRLSAALVSHRIQVLERHLGCRLFNRTTRRIQLTEQGRAFYERCLEIREAVERAEASIAEAGATPRGTLKVTAPLGLGRRLIAPLLPRHRRQHPELSIRLRLSDHLLDLLIETVDVAVRMDAFADSSLMIRRIAELPRVLCASPDYLDRHGAPRSLADLAGHQCLMLRFPGSTQFRWPFPDRDGKPLLLAPSGGLDADDGDVLTDWALAGEGIVLKPVFEVAEHLRAGALVPPLRPHAAGQGESLRRPGDQGGPRLRRAPDGAAAVHRPWRRYGSPGRAGRRRPRRLAGGRGRGGPVRSPSRRAASG